MSGFGHVLSTASIITELGRTPFSLQLPMEMLLVADYLVSAVVDSAGCSGLYHSRTSMQRIFFTSISDSPRHCLHLKIPVVSSWILLLTRVLWSLFNRSRSSFRKIDRPLCYVRSVLGMARTGQCYFAPSSLLMH